VSVLASASQNAKGMMSWSRCICALWVTQATIQFAAPPVLMWRGCTGCAWRCALPRVVKGPAPAAQPPWRCLRRAIATAPSRPRSASAKLRRDKFTRGAEEVAGGARTQGDAHVRQGMVDGREPVAAAGAVGSHVLEVVKGIFCAGFQHYPASSAALAGSTQTPRPPAPHRSMPLVK
jgi:hypothetical protein